MAKIGYARVSTHLQNTDTQVERLKADGCTRVYVDHGASGAKASRPEWDKCLDRLEAGDTLVAVKLDRVGRSVRNLIDVSQDLDARGVSLKMLDQPIDTTTSMGRLFFTIIAAIAEFERELIRERTVDGLKATKARGRQGGRKPRLSAQQVEYVRHLRASGYSIGRIQDELANGKGRPGRTTIYRALGMTSNGTYEKEQAS